MEVGIPCDLTPPSPGDSPHLILWYKNIFGSPIYRSAFLLSIKIKAKCDQYHSQCGSSCWPFISFSLARSFTGRQILFPHSPIHLQLNSPG